MQNAAAQSAMPQYEEQGHGTMHNTVEQKTMPRLVRAMPRLKEQCHSIPLHGKNAMAQHTMQPPKQWHDAQ